MELSLVTSLYRTEQHLPTFIERARRVLDGVQATGLSIELIMVANDATEEERHLIDAFTASGAPVRVLHVPRETLYASWNRGVQSAQGTAIGFWNVDDARTVDGLVQGYARIADGCLLVYFAHRVVRSGRFRQHQRDYPAVPYSAELHRRVMKCGPFFLFQRALYEQIGPFDERFRISGDFEWCARATDHVDLCPLNVLAGTFFLHGGNLSDTGDPRQIAEINVVHLLRENYEYLTPCEPELMRKTWALWKQNHILPESVEVQLWGEGANERWQAWLIEQERQRRRREIEEMLRYWPKMFIDRTGLRSQLARMGLVKARSNTQADS